MFTEEEKAQVKNLYLVEGQGPLRFINEFPQKTWKKRGLDELLKKLTVEPVTFQFALNRNV